MNTLDDDYQTLFLIFQQVLNFWQGNSDEENVEMMFQSATILEEAFRKLEITGARDHFEDKLKEFCEFRGINCVPFQFFNKASDHILSRYMVDGKFSDYVVNAAVQQFTTHRSERDFYEFAQQLANSNQTVETLRKSLISSESVENYKAQHCLEEIRKGLISCRGDVEDLYSEVSKSISNDPSVFKIFLRVLCMPSDSEITDHLKEVVALSLSNSLRDISNTNLYPFLLDLNEQEFEEIVIKYHNFIDAFLQTIRASVERLKCDYSGNAYTWTITGTDPCLSFDQIITILTRCKILPGIEDKVKELLQKIGEEGFGILAEDIALKCKIR